MSSPLRDVVVLDFTRHLPGPYCTDVLRRLGARVLKIEPPDGDPTRWLPPYDGDWGALFTLINEGKESVVVDLKSEEGRALIHQLASRCDVVVESYRPGVAATFGVDAATLRRIRPSLVYCSISGFGQANPRSAHDLDFVALSGLLDLQRDPSGKPVLPATQLGDMAGALFAALSIVAALHARARSGEGATLDISMADATRAMMPTAEALYRGTHHTPETFWLTGGLPYYDVYRTRDGKYLAVAALEPRFWEAFCHAVGAADLIPRQFDDAARGEIEARLRAVIGARDRSEWEAIFRGVDACVEPVLTIEEAHERFGDPLARGPLAKNFPSPSLPPPPLGSALEAAAGLAGLKGEEKNAVLKGKAFAPAGKLKQFMTRTVLKLKR